MALKILMGVLQIDGANLANGHATIDFSPHQVQGDAVGVNLQQLGDPGDYDEAPGVIVSVTRVDATAFLARYDIDVSTPSSESVVVRWTANNMHIHEIAYQIVGDA